MGEEAYSSLGALAGSIIKTTAHTGGDVAVATQGPISGVVYSAEHLGVDAEKAVSTAATEAVKAGYEIGAEVSGIK